MKKNIKEYSDGKNYYGIFFYNENGNVCIGKGSKLHRTLDKNRHTKRLSDLREKTYRDRLHFTGYDWNVIEDIEILTDSPYKSATLLVTGGREEDPKKWMFDDKIEVPKCLIELFSSTTEPNTILAINSKLQSFFNLCYSREFRRNYTFAEILKPKSAGAIGCLKSQLSSIVHDPLHDIFNNRDNTFHIRDKDQIDWERNPYRGDLKTSFTSNDDGWTCNGSSNKLGHYLLIRYVLTDDVPLKNIKVKELFCGLIHSKYMIIKRGLKKSDVSMLYLPLHYSNQLHVMHGKTKDCKKYTHCTAVSI